MVIDFGLDMDEDSGGGGWDTFQKLYAEDWCSQI